MYKNNFNSGYKVLRYNKISCIAFTLFHAYINQLFSLSIGGYIYILYITQKQCDTFYSDEYNDKREKLPYM